MKKLVLSLCAATFVAALSFSAMAEEKKPPKGDAKKPDPEMVFKRMDKNTDGKVSLEEFTGKREGDKAEQAKKQFARLDKNSDGSLSLEEFKARGGKPKPADK